MAEPTEQEKAAAEKAEADKQAAEAAKAKAEQEAADAKKREEEAKLGDAGKAALDAERKARREAEKAAREAQAKLDKIEKDSLSETDRLKKEAEEGKQAAEKATAKLRQANLIGALADKGITGAKAKAAARLLDDVEYDDTDEPTNLDAAIKAASEVYGADQFKTGGGASRPNVNGNEGNEGGDPPNLTAEELAIAKSFGMTPDEYAKEKDPAYDGEPAKT